MKIEFRKIKEKKIPHFKGGEKETAARMFLDEYNRIMKGRLEPGASIGMHRHEESSEIIFIMEGTGKVLFDDDVETVKAGDCHYCPSGHSHSLINDSTKDLVFYCVVPQHSVN